MKSVKELSESLGISRVAIYKKIHNQLTAKLKGHIFKGDNGIVLDETAEKIIIRSLHRKKQESAVVVENNLENDLCKPTVKPQELVETLETIGILREQLNQKETMLLTVIDQLKSKDLQIQSLLQVNQGLLDALQSDERIKLVADTTETDFVSNTVSHPKVNFLAKLFMQPKRDAF